MTITVEGYPIETLKYLPRTIGVLAGKGLNMSDVVGAISFPPGEHPANCPIRKDLIAVRIEAKHGYRWHGTQTAFIDSSLQFVVGVNPADEVLRRWRDYASD